MAPMGRFVCVACGTQFAQSAQPPASCPICEDPRQYVPEAGQRWTTLEELRGDHANRVADEGELVGIGTDPWFAIGQRALLVPFGEQRVMWDCVTLVDDASAAEVERRGGHFAGGTVLHHAGGADGRGALLSGDIVQVVPDRRHVAFMYGYPNLIPLPPGAVAAIGETLAPLDFEVLYGAWWGTLVYDAKAAVERSAARYVQAVQARCPPPA
jgi:hypothetical protein